LLNNRQAGRRRGRGGQRQQNGGRDNGNRIDNRARGNAPQMLEKYKTLARDAQMAGDRVMTEYYLQFADHYFRVVAETRARFEENRPQRDDWQGDDGYEGDDQGTSDNADRESEDVEQDRQQPPRREFRDRNDQDRSERGNRDNRNDRNGNDRGNGRYNGNRNRDADDQQAEAEPATIDVAVLPPAFGSDGMVSPIVDLDPPVEEQAPAPRRRGRPRRPAEDATTES
jgi:Domain of unknown function (DUF4167)